MSTEEASESEASVDVPAKPARTPEEKALAKKLKHRAKWKLFWIVSIVSLVADQATKVWARASLPTYPYGADKSYVCQIPEDIIPSAPKCGAEAVAVIDSFWHWRLSMNPGSAFGLFSGQGQVGRVLLSLVGIGAVIGMMWMLKKARADQKVLHWALALVAGGAVGNLIDRVYYGVVTDFILWHWGTTPAKNNPNHFATEWPVFNIADVVLVVGVGLMFIDIQKEGKREKEKKKRRAEKARAAGLVKDM
jgi:signal peptidase II